MIQLIAFRFEHQLYALPLAAVERVVRAVEITPLPKAPPIVLGIVNIAGRILPVIDIRKRFRLPEKKIDPDDKLILAHTGRRSLGLVVEEVSSVLERPESDVTSGRQILPGLEGVQGVVRMEDGMIVIYDLAKFLSLEEEAALADALETIQDAARTE